VPTFVIKVQKLPARKPHLAGIQTDWLPIILRTQLLENQNRFNLL